MMPIIETLKQYANLIVGVIALALIGYAAYWLHHDGYIQGKAEVQAEFDTHLAADQAAVNEAVKLSEEINGIVQKQHEADINFVQSKAGTDAVNRYLASHGLLPSSGSMCGEQSGAGGQALSLKLNDATSGKPRIGDSNTEFAKRCATDALAVLVWQEFAVRNGLPVVK